MALLLGLAPASLLTPRSKDRRSAAPVPSRCAPLLRSSPIGSRLDRRPYGARLSGRGSAIGRCTKASTAPGRWIHPTFASTVVIGVVGSIAAYQFGALPSNESLAQYVLDNPSALWFVGPLFAALTGLVFKEGLCYGKLEAGILTFVIPGLLLGHLSGLMDNGPKLSLLGLWMALFVVFARESSSNLSRTTSATNPYSCSMLFLKRKRRLCFRSSRNRAIRSLISVQNEE
uniref:Uncharacterized protein n=1 Tax=Ananas comosus var. bracteatus TaxID=296719 RepID=A0A6V7QUY4_ANACO